jgi:hypothetical protein
MPHHPHRFPFDRRCRMARLSHHLPGLTDVGLEAQQTEFRRAPCASDALWIEGEP